MARLSERARAQIKPSNFAIPPDGYPIDTKKRARVALGLVGMHGNAQEKAQVRGAVARKYPDIDQTRGNAKKPGDADRISNEISRRLDAKAKR